MRDANLLLRSTVRFLGTGTVCPTGATPSADLLTDGSPETGVGWHAGGETAGLEVTFRGPVRVDAVVCRWSAMPAAYAVDVKQAGAWVAAEEVADNPVLGPKIKLHLPGTGEAEALRIRIQRELAEDIHGRERAAPCPVFLSGLEVHAMVALPGHVRRFLEKETPRLVSTPEHVAKLRASGGYRPDAGLLEAPVPEWEPMPREQYFRTEAGKALVEQNLQRQRLLTGCAEAYDRSGDARYAERGREVLLAILAHYDRYQSFRFRGIEWKAVTYQDPAYYIEVLTRAYDRLASSSCLTLQDRLRFVYGLIDIGAFQCDAIRDRFVARENWAANSLAEIALLAFYLEGFPETADWLRTARSRFAACFDHYLDDGTWWECSPAHAVYMLRGMLKYVLARQLAGERLWDRDYNGKSLVRLVEALCKTATPFGEYPSINDSTGNDTPLLEDLPELRAPLYLIGRGDFLEALKDRGAPPFVPGLALTAPERAVPDHTSVLLPDAGFAVMRDGWGRDDGYLILDYGPHGGGHGHPDKLSFILIADGHHWVPDAANTPHYSTFPEQGTWHKQTVSHNTVLANGTSQEPCTGELVYWHHDADVDAVCARHTEGYAGLAHRRTIVHPRGEYYLVHDVLDADESGFDLEWLLHVNGVVEHQEPGRLWFRNGDRGLLLVSDAIGDGEVEIHQGLCGGFRHREWAGPGFPGPGEPGWVYVPYIRLPKRVEAGARAEYLAVLVPYRGKRPEVEVAFVAGANGRSSGVRIRKDDTVDEYLDGFRRSVGAKAVYAKRFDAAG